MKFRVNIKTFRSIVFLYGTFFLNRLEEDKRKIRDKRIYYISYIILCATGRNFCCTAIYECMFFFISSYFFFCFPFLNYLQHATEIIQRRKTELF